MTNPNPPYIGSGIVLYHPDPEAVTRNLHEILCSIWPDFAHVPVSALHTACEDYASWDDLDIVLSLAMSEAELEVA